MLLLRAACAPSAIAQRRRGGPGGGPTGLGPLGACASGAASAGLRQGPKPARQAGRNVAASDDNLVCARAALRAGDRRFVVHNWPFGGRTNLDINFKEIKTSCPEREESLHRAQELLKIKETERETEIEMARVKNQASPGGDWK